MKQELASTKERYLQELDQAPQDAELRAQQPSPVFAAASTQPYATSVEENPLHAVAAVAQAAPVPAFHSPGLSLGAPAGYLNIKSRSKGSSTMVVPVRRRLRAKTALAAAQRVPNMGLGRRRMRSKGPAPQPQPQPLAPSGSGGVPDPAQPGPQEEEIRLLVAAYQDLAIVHLHRRQDFLFTPGLPFQQAPGGPPGDGGDSGGDEGETPQDTDQDSLQPLRPRPYGDPDSSGDDGGKDRQ